MEQSPLIGVGLPIALFVIMVGIGLTLTPADFGREARRPKGSIAGFVAQLFVMPAVGFTVAWVLDLPPASAVGIVLVSACPGGTTSNLVAYLARANVALSVVLTVTACVAAIFTLPFFVNLALGTVQGEAGGLSLPVVETLATLMVIVLVPVSVGMAVRAFAPGFARRMERAFSVFGGVVFVLLVVAIAVSVWDQLAELLLIAGPASVALNLAGIVVGWASGAVAGLDWHGRLAIAVEIGVKNTALGLLVSVTLLESPEIAVIPAVYGVLMYVSGLALVAYGRRNMRLERLYPTGSSGK